MMPVKLRCEIFSVPAHGEPGWLKRPCRERQRATEGRAEARALAGLSGRGGGALSLAKRRKEERRKEERGERRGEGRRRALPVDVFVSVICCRHVPLLLGQQHTRRKKENVLPSGETRIEAERGRVETGFGGDYDRLTTHEIMYGVD